MPKAAACKRIARNAKGLQERRVQFSRNKEKRKAEAGTGRGEAHRMRFSRSGGYAEEGYEWAVPLDLSKYFDTLNHEKLLNILRETVKDEPVIQLIKKYLYWTRRVPNGTHGAVRGREFVTASYSIAGIIRDK